MQAPICKPVNICEQLGFRIKESVLLHSPSEVNNGNIWTLLDTYLFVYKVVYIELTIIKYIDVSIQ